MLLKEFLGETIVNPPRNRALYLKNRVKGLNQCIEQSAHLKAVLKTTDDGEYLVNYGLRQSENPDATSCYGLDSIDVAREYNLEHLRDSLESVANHGISFLKFVFSSLDYAKPVSETYKAVLAALPMARKGLVEYGYDPDKPEDHDDEYRSAVTLIEAGEALERLINRVEAIQANIRIKLGPLVRMQDYSLDPSRYRPIHGAVETLYHATIYANDIIRDGFLPTKPSERRGLGNLGSQSKISFTHDLEIARTIARYLRELWMIQHGQLTGRQIISWMRHEGIDLKQAWSTFGRGPFPKEGEMTPEQTVPFFRYWVAMSKLRKDPVIISPEETMKLLANLSMKDIGILQCEVELSGDEEFLHVEAEFRVPASAVKSVKRIL